MPPREAGQGRPSSCVGCQQSRSSTRDTRVEARDTRDTRVPPQHLHNQEYYQSQEPAYYPSQPDNYCQEQDHYQDFSILSAL